MGTLYDLKRQIDQEIQSRGLEQYRVRGQIGLKSGIILGMLSAETPDDPVRIQKLRDAIKAVIGVSL